MQIKDIFHNCPEQQEQQNKVILRTLEVNSRGQKCAAEWIFI